MELIQYDCRFKQAFIDLNTAWITGLFGFLEQEDLNTFHNIETELQKGAMIYFAVEQDNVMATCMTKRLDDHTWEICKLAAAEHSKGHGAGSAVFERCMDYAILHGAERLFILSNSRLAPALHIYRKHGFQEIKLDHYEYERGDIAFEYLVQGPAATLTPPVNG